MSIKRTIIAAVVGLALVAMVAPGVAQSVTIDELLAQIAQLQAQLLSLQGGSTPVPTGNVACAGVTFTRALVVGSTGTDVKCLQVLLNTNGYTLAATGAGSPGMETSYFGPITLAAVRQFQVAKGWTPANQVGPLTRAALNALISTTPGTPPVVTPTAGGLTVALAYDNPPSGNVANGSSADFTKFLLTAGAGDVTINKLYVTRSGLSTNSAVSNIKVVDAATGAYVGSIGSLNTNNMAMITFTQGLTIPANTSKEYILRGSIASSASGNAPAGNTIALGVNGADITSNATGVSGMATGNLMSVVNITVGTVQVAEDGATVDSAPNVGDTGVTLNQFYIQAGSTEDITVQAVTMLKAGTISNNYLANLTLYNVTKGTTLATVPSLNAEGKATFGNLNLVISKGNTERFRIKADIVDGPGLTANADVVDGSDVLVVAKGNTYGFYITPTAVGSWGGQGTANQTVQSGGLTISKSASTPATGNTSAGNDKLVTTFDFNAAGEAMKVSSVMFTATLGTMTYDQVTNIRIFDENGAIVAGPADLGSGSTVTFTDTFIVPVGIHKYSVKVKIASGVSTNDTIKIGIANPRTDVTATGMTSNSSINVNPSGSAVNGNTLTVKGGSLAVTTNNTPAGRYIAEGSSGLILGTFTLSAASSGEDVQVTSMTVYDVGSGTTDMGDFTNLALYTGTNFGTRISQVYSNASGTSQAFPLTQTLTVPAGGYVTVAIVGDLKTSAGNTTHIMEIDGTVGSVTANGASTGSSITTTGSALTYAVTGAQTLTVSTGGALTVSKDSTSPVADFIVGNSDVTLAVFQLRASNVEDLSVSEINLSVTTGGDVASYSFYKSDGTLLGTVPGGLTPKLVLSSGALTIPANGYQRVTVKAHMSSVDGTTVANSDAVTATIQGTNQVKATGLGSGSEVTTTSAQSAIGSTQYLVRAKPTVTAETGASLSGTSVGNAAQLLAIFDVTNTGEDDIQMASANSDQLVVHLSRSLATSNSTSRTWTLKDEAGTTIDAVTNFNDTSGTSVTFDFSTTLTIGAGATKKLYVYGDTSEYTHTSSATDSLQLYLSDGTAGDLHYSVITNGSADAVANAATYVFRGGIYAGRFTY